MATKYHRYRCQVLIALDMDAERAAAVVPNLIRLADDDGNGTIEWHEFFKIFQVTLTLAGLVPWRSLDVARIPPMPLSAGAQ